jgi:CubicO group peptidase (beta-lactamase class C family)
MNEFTFLKNKKLMLIAGIVLIISQFIIATSFAKAIQQPPSSEALGELDKFIQDYNKTNNVPGTVVAVASKGKLIHFKSYGVANVELSVPVSNKTVFEIGSISKQFTSAVAMLLVQEKKLDVNDSIHQYLPFLPSEWLGVTVHQLLNHTSGIPDYEEIGSYDIYRHRVTPEDVIKIAQSRPTDFPPGTGWYYSNTGYYLLSMIIERIEGLPLGHVLKNRIFDPLQMAETRMADPEAIIPNRASGYWINKTNNLINRNPTETSSTLGAGGLLSTANDLAKWDNALYGESLLSSQSKKIMWSDVIIPGAKSNHYGYGWNLRDIEGLKSTRHRGQVAGFNTEFVRLPNEGLAIIVLTNRYKIRTGPITKKVLHTFIPGLESSSK